MINDRDITVTDLMGAPYGKNGRGPGFFDCAGLFYEIARRLGRKVPLYDTPFEQDKKNRLLESIVKKNFRRIDGPKDWCAVVFRIFNDDGKENWHIGHMLPGGERFIHITEKTSVCTTSINHSFWSFFIEGFYEYG